ncbi:GNAT family N-acetyltransferase [Amycolatopsis australiensis]|uniref:Predicted acetyltransferase, GNAT superfamily n=1 Tax=Amycolatopsis australiensis TaxID=546364 RepID=A0A1K1S5X1_9PSEU|nr:GNAT family N-acetyltransferase [Amycolatopsis australiensis]SFW79610.1 Predicted acetyltransferase, GNAT superfamily [Amycolatopsis australiensis]
MTEVVTNTAPPLRDEAAAAAAAAATASGVEVRTLAEVADLTAVTRLFESIWRPAPGNPPVTAELLRAMVSAGNYVAGAFDGPELLGACFGFFGGPGKGGLHSHIAGVATAGHGRGIGFALKLHQRAWALRQDVTSISWTFDPLVRRNAHFNLTKLAARPQRYLPDFYGPMHDGINGAGDSDRLMVAWDLASPPVRAAAAGVPARLDAVSLRDRGAAVALAADAGGAPVTGPADAPLVLVAVPPDIEALRRADPERGRAWRVALRDVLGGLLAGGASVTGFDRAGWYVVAKEQA